VSSQQRQKAREGVYGRFAAGIWGYREKQVVINNPNLQMTQLRELEAALQLFRVFLSKAELLPVAPTAVSSVARFTTQPSPWI
jgi:hypothetical protein